MVLVDFEVFTFSRNAVDDQEALVLIDGGEDAMPCVAGIVYALKTIGKEGLRRAWLAALIMSDNDEKWGFIERDEGLRSERVAFDIMDLIG